MFRTTREAAHQQRCQNNLRQIALAIQNYHDAHGQFPSAYLSGTDGKPAHSWRVAIWPFMVKGHRYHLYSYSEPWNGPNNSKLEIGFPDVYYRCPGESTTKPGMTNYVAVVGARTMWQGNGYMRYADILNGASNLIMVVEISNSNIHWMEPRDLPIEELSAWLDPNHKPTLLASHASGRIKGGLVVFADGHTEFVPHNVIEKRLRALLSPAENDAAEAKEP